MVSIRDLAIISDKVYDLDNYSDWIIFKSVDHSIWSEEEGRPDKCGFKAAIYINDMTEERVVAFAGTEIRNGEVDPGDIANDLQITTKEIPHQAYKALNFFKENEKSPYNTIIIGHSLGGALASIVGNEYKTRTVTFNSPGTSGLRCNHPETGRYEVIIKDPNAKNFIFHYLIYDDTISECNYQLGQEYWAKVEGDNHHTIKQWTDYDRYDSEGNYDPDKEINKIVYAAETYQRPKRL